MLMCLNETVIKWKGLISLVILLKIESKILYYCS